MTLSITNSSHPYSDILHKNTVSHFAFALSFYSSRVQDAVETFKKFVIRVSFVYTKQPLRIAQVLKQVYPVDPSNVDDELVERFDRLIYHLINTVLLTM